MDGSEFLSRKVREIEPSGIRKFFDWAGKYPDAISLGVGEPDFATPTAACRAAVRSVLGGSTAYTSNRGLIALREEISEYLAARFGVRYSPSEIIVTVGASEGIDIALRALVDFGDEVLVPDPAFVSYAPLVRLAGGVPIAVDCIKPSAEALERAVTPRTKAVILPYPNNPTGAVLTKKELNEICRVIVRRDLAVLADEIYAELTYEGRHVSAASLAGMRERTVLVSGFSKAFAMTGWRVGYVCAPRSLSDGMLKVHQYAVMCAPTAGQYAALAALRDGKLSGYSEVERMRAEYDERRIFTLSALGDMKLPCPYPQGAFYVFADVSGTGMRGDEFAEKLLREKHVATVPGSAFGRSGENFVRISYAASSDKLREALARVAEFVSERK